jgi:hypothetical protein
MIELEHFLTGGPHIIRHEHTQSPGVGITASREEAISGVFQLFQPRQRDDESSEGFLIGAIEI